MVDPVFMYRNLFQKYRIKINSVFLFYFTKIMKKLYLINFTSNSNVNVNMVYAYTDYINVIYTIYVLNSYFYEPNRSLYR